MTMIERVALALGGDKVNARLAIEAMREPSDAMIKVAVASGPADTWRDAIVRDWHVMIDTALKEGDA